MEITQLWLDALMEHSGMVRMLVRGSSMRPTLRPGDELLIEPISAQELLPGDWVVVRDDKSGYVHRFLTWRRGGLLTKGDAHRRYDPLWPVQALIGRVVVAHRAGKRIYHRTPARLQHEQRLARRHLRSGAVWDWLHRCKVLVGWLGLWLITALIVQAAVTVTNFGAAWDGDLVRVTWETASEVGNLGFYVWRSDSETGPYDKIPVRVPGSSPAEFVPGGGSEVGGVYEVFDDAVTVGQSYFYKLQDVPDDGTTGDFFGPFSPAAPPVPTATPSPMPTPTATSIPPTATPPPIPTPTATPIPPTATLPPPTATPVSWVRFWADPTSLTAGACTTLQWQTDHVQAVFLDGRGTLGVGAKTVCPCASETHLLRVLYPDGRSEEFSLTISVRGHCEATASPAPTATSTPRPRPTTRRPPTKIPRSTATAIPIASATFTVPLPPTVKSQSVSPTPVTPTPTVTSSFTPMISPLRPPYEVTSTPLVVEGGSLSPHQGSRGWLYVGGLFGLSLIALGGWLWYRQR